MLLALRGLLELPNPVTGEMPGLEFLKPVSVNGDSGNHGGVVMSSGAKLHGVAIPVTLDGDLYICPYHGSATVIAGEHKLTHQGVKVACVGDQTSCGDNIVGPGCAKFEAIRAN